MVVGSSLGIAGCVTHLCVRNTEEQTLSYEFRVKNKVSKLAGISS